MGQIGLLLTIKRISSCCCNLWDTITCYAANCIPLLIQQNVDGSNFFNRSWAEFKVGFKDSRGNYWLGNERLHQLTTGRYKLRCDLQAQNLSWYYAEYSTFVVFSEASSYRISVSGYSGNAGDAFLAHDGLMFTTFDRDNDPWKSTRYNNNCAVWNGGGFWYSGCSSASVNNVRGRGGHFKWHGSGVGYTLLQSCRMWLMCWSLHWLSLLEFTTKGPS